jgi:AcrR family transcriptional regulator
MRSPARAPGTDVRRSLLRAALAEIEENGIGRVSLRAIARRCGVSHQASAHHFDDRAGLFTVLATEGFEALLARSQRAIEAADLTGDDPLVAAAMAYLDFAAEQPTTFDVMFRPELVHADDPALAGARLAMWAHGQQVVETTQAEGWAPGVPPEVLNMACWSTIHGYAMLRRDAAAMSAAGVPEIDAEAMVRAVITALVRAPLA